MHRAGFICGDVNHSNILVRQTATVAAVDCDSFQVGDGSRFPCLVGTELFVPPELIGAQLGAIRSCAQPEGPDAQLTRYLAGLRIEDAKLSNIGPARCTVLRSWGIDTAADIDEAKISEIPGFGKGLTDKLVIWREFKEKSFVPSTASIVDPHEVQRIDRRLAARRAKLMKELRERITEIERCMSDFLKERDLRWARVEAAYQARLAHR